MVLHYLAFMITFTILIYFAYIKLKYPFWSSQPVYHNYDVLRSMYNKPFIINRNTPMKTKYYDHLHVQTFNYSECENIHKNELLNLIQCYYINSDKILHNISLKDLECYFIGHSEPAYVSIYAEQQYDQIYDVSGSIISSSFIPAGCITSRKSNFWYSINDKNTNYHEMAIYFVDYLCANRNGKQKNIYRNLLQTHEFNQRIKNPNIQCSLIKKEIELFQGIVPFVQFNTNTYHIPFYEKQPLPAGYYITKLEEKTIASYADFFYSNNDYCSKTHLFDVIVFPDIGNVVHMIRQGILHIYCLKNKQHIYGFYFFKDANMHYEELDGNTLHFTNSVMNCLSPTIFYNAFVNSIQDLVHKNKTYKMMLFEDIGHNEILLQFWNQHNSPIFTNLTAYYLYNFVYPIKVAKKRVFILN